MPKERPTITSAAATPAGWSSECSAELYGINTWGAGYFDLSEQGEAQVNVDFGEHQVAVSIMDIVLGMPTLTTYFFRMREIYERC